MDNLLNIIIKNNINVCVPNSVYHLTPYVLLEQEDWFEDEIKYLRHIIKPGMNVIDVGANYGIYSLTIAKIVGSQGKVWSFEPGSPTDSFFKESILKNRMDNIQFIKAALSNKKEKAKFYLSPSCELNSLRQSKNHTMGYEIINILRIDDCVKEYGWENIDFIKLDAEGEEKNIIQGASEFLQSQSPLVMLELRDGDKINLPLIKQISELGYMPYQLIPSLNLIAPADLSEPADSFGLNIFCCKPDRARLLEAQGALTFDSSLNLEIFDNIDFSWRNHISELPFASSLIENWEIKLRNSPAPGWEIYQKALNCYVLAQSDNIPNSTRYYALKKSLLLLLALVETHPNLSRLQTLARIYWELGLRFKALDILNKFSVFEGYLVAEEPFLPVSPRFDSIDPSDNFLNWLHASLQEQTIKTHVYSTYNADNSIIPILDNLKNWGFEVAEMERARQLMRIRAGLQKEPEYSPILVKKTKDNLNPHLWIRS